MSNDTCCPCGKNQSACSTPIQNGKGDAPRNISPEYRSRFDSINWSPREKATAGRFVKAY